MAQKRKRLSRLEASFGKSGLRRQREVWDRQRRRLKAIPVVTLLPNAITLLALCSGMTSIRMAIIGEYELAVLALLAAAVLDVADGLIARALRGGGGIGAQLDSLADLVSFGVAPPLILYHWGEGMMRGVGWAAGLMFTVCCALRLARFNIESDMPRRPGIGAYDFVGLPTPGAAGLALTPLYLDQVFGGMFPFFRSPWFIALIFAALSAGLLSRLPTPSMKGALSPRVDIDQALIGLVIMVLTVTAAISYPWEMALFASFLYLAAIARKIVAYRREKDRRKTTSSGKTSDPQGKKARADAEKGGTSGGTPSDSAAKPAPADRETA